MKFQLNEYKRNIPMDDLIADIKRVANGLIHKKTFAYVLGSCEYLKTQQPIFIPLSRSGMKERKRSRGYKLMTTVVKKTLTTEQAINAIW
jgi:hypothetical protein